jgi:hypothetical protein
MPRRDSFPFEITQFSKLFLVLKRRVIELDLFDPVFPSHLCRSFRPPLLIVCPEGYKVIHIRLVTPAAIAGDIRSVR